MKRFALLICLALLIKIQLCDVLVFLGRDLQTRGNLPHRAIGTLFAAHLLAPHRQDISMEYIQTWFFNANDYSLVEGQMVPVVPIFASKLAQENLNDDQICAWSEFLKQETLKRRKNTKLEMVLHQNGEKITAEIK